MDDTVKFLSEIAAESDDDSKEFLQELLLEMMEGY